MERYLKPLVDNLILGVINEESKGRVIRDDDKAFIARVFSYIFIGVRMDWIKDDRRGDPKEIVENLAKLLKGSITSTLKKFAL